jgi:ABC-type amino acid transport system permease subunit
LPQFGIRLSPILAGILGLTINTTAYYAEIFRAGIQSVSRGQWEAAQSIGISDFATFKIIILPQGLKNIWPSLTNQFIMIIFGTSLLSVLDVRELTQQASILISTTLRTLEIYVFVILMYYVMTIAFSALLNVVNHKLFPAIK